MRQYIENMRKVCHNLELLLKVLEDLGFVGEEECDDDECLTQNWGHHGHALLYVELVAWEYACRLVLLADNDDGLDVQCKIQDGNSQWRYGRMPYEHRSPSLRDLDDMMRDRFRIDVGAWKEGDPWPKFDIDEQQACEIARVVGTWFKGLEVQG
ncbi:MAG: hypothetical protein Q7T01_04175 [bacterium]|nr:hypothetical protein [bacterium]